MSTELVNYSQQINAAHQAVLDAKELGGKKAHECGTWLRKQKESLPYGEWKKWVEDNCEFEYRMVVRYMAVAGLEVTRVSHLSLRDALWEVADEKGFRETLKEDHREALKEREIREDKQTPEQRKEEEEKAEVRRETQVRQATIALKIRAEHREVALEVIKAGYREMSKKYHPDSGGTKEDMQVVNAVKEAFDTFIDRKWRKP